ncbi:MAG: FxLYD domain-containing protein [Candidatus Wallbacteria bacterium]|nr:FxLYD domain-containing protein [Candidatus Wallbacteria bacterium]
MKPFILLLILFSFRAFAEGTGEIQAAKPAEVMQAAGPAPAPTAQASTLQAVKPTAKPKTTVKHRRIVHHAKKTTGTADFLTFDSCPGIRITSTRFEKIGNIPYFTGIVQNRSDRTYWYLLVKVSLYNRDQNLVGLIMDNALSLGPGKTWKFMAEIEACGTPAAGRITDIYGGTMR